MVTTGQKVGVVFGSISTLSGLGSAIYLSTWITIEQQILKEGFKLISHQEDYKFILFNNKDNLKLKEAISKKTLDYQIHWKEIKEWCEKNFKEWMPNDELLKNVKAWCTVPKIRTLKDKLNVKLHKQGAWENKFKELASKSEEENKLLKALNVTKPEGKLTKDSKEGGEKLSEWCNSALEQKIYEVDVTYKTEKNIEEWCFEKA